MKPADNREEALFREAINRAPGQERADFLDQACAGDDKLRNRLEALIEAHERSTSLLDPQVTLPDKATLRVEVPQEEGSGTIIGRYKLLQRIGEGGMGIVYMAEQEEPVRRRVALKIIKLGMDTRQVVARFEVERQALALMDHPNIARVFDGGATETGRPYLVMELVQGVPITTFCDKNKLPTQERLKLFIQVCQAVQSAHQKAIIHRDLKPSNVLVTLHHGEPMAKVIDFGVAKATNQKLTEKTLFTNFATMIGTPAYMSPEQAEMSSLDIDTRTDVYSLGVLLYELLAGSTPFPDQRLRSLGYGEMQRVIMEEEPERPSTRLSTMTNEQKSVVAKNHGEELASISNVLKGDLDWIVMKCLEKDRRRRYETAISLAADLKRHLDNEPVVARPPSTAYRLQKAWRRNKLAFTAGAAVVAALVVGIGISTWQAVIATRAKKEAIQSETKAVAAQKQAEVAQQAEKQARLRADMEKAEASHNLYIANMNLAQQAWDENNIDRVRQLLEDTKDSPHRGFEWYYWQRQIHLASITFRGHLDVVNSVACSSDGQRIVTGSADKTAKIWDAASGREILALNGHTAEIHSVAFSPDGKRIITGAGDLNNAHPDHTARVWDGITGRELLQLRAHSGCISAVAYSPDGQRIATGSMDGTAKVWEAASGKELLTLKGSASGIHSVGFSPDGQRIVAGSWDGTAKLWEVSSGREIVTLKGHVGAVSVAFSPDGLTIATGGPDETVKVWEAATGKELLALKGFNYSVAFSPDGHRIIAGGYDKIVRAWELPTGKELFKLKGHSSAISSVAFSPDGQRIITGSGDNTAKIWESASAQTSTIFKQQSRCTHVLLSPDGQRIVAGSRDGTVTVWETESGQEVLRVKGHKGEVDCAAFSPDGQRIAIASEDKTAIWEVASGRELLTVKGLTHMSRIAFSPDGQKIITCGSTQTPNAHSTAKVWDAKSGREVFTLNGHDGFIASVLFSPDGHRIATVSEDRTAKLWDAASGREMLKLQGLSILMSVNFSPDGQRLLTGGDGTATVWDLITAKESLIIKWNGGFISSIAFSPDGNRIVVGDADQTSRVLEAASGRQLLTLRAHSATVSSIALSPDSRRIATASFGAHDAEVAVWKAARPEQVTAWREEEQTADQVLGPQQRAFVAEQDRQRIAIDSSYLKQWLVLGPIATPKNRTGAEELEFQEISGEATLAPKLGERKSILGAEFKWRDLVLESPSIDFNTIFGQETTASVAYGVCYIRSEAEQRGLQMLVGSDDEAKIYLNGKEVYRSILPRSFALDQDTVPNLAVNVGLNVLVFKVVNEGGEWLGSIRLIDASGNPVNGIKVAPDPEAKEKAEIKEP